MMCHQCGAALVVPPSRAKRRKFCSHDCRHKWMSENQRGRAHPMYGRRHSPESLAKMRAVKSQTAKRGPAAATWKGGRFQTRGYWMIALSAIPPEDRWLAEPMISSGRVYLAEHRLVMARALGRPLTKSEVVHHINGVKSDNRLDNLEIHGARTHKMTHAEMYRELRTLRALAGKCSCGMFPKDG